jgi:glycyl-tRNA synthetase
MGEREHSTYYFDVADVKRVRQMYELYEEEAERAIDAGLVLPAHDYVLKTSHAFNILDTRGAVGVTERQALFKRTRELARQVAAAYVEQRKSANFPWLVEEEMQEEAPLSGLEVEITSDSAPFVLEIGTEELPPSDLADALSQLEASVPSLMDDLYLAYDEIKIMGTPRRLVVSIEGLAARQPDRSLDVKGPPADRAFDGEGNPTRAAEGFARSKGIDVSDLVVEEVDDGEYVVAHIKEQGQSATKVLHEALPDLIGGIRFNKSMRWNKSGVAFSRPIRWLLALHGDNVIPFKFAGYTSGRVSRGLRFEKPEQIEVQNPKEYFEKIASQGILLDPKQRKAEILAQANQLAAEVGGHVGQETDLQDEVTNLVEVPTAFRGQFDESYLEVLPPEVLISVMKKHQRYFVVKDNQGQLMPYFIGVRNGGEKHLETVIDGNEQVILARFDDATFFVKKDLQQPLENFVDDLDTLTFEVKLGSFLEKTVRITALVKSLGARLKLSKEEMQITQRAAKLCKADLATNMVVEMTSLQGVMGRYYALHSGEKSEVADAIFEHYLPRSADDKSPETKPGLVVGLADRLDSLIGLFAVGLAPTGTKDPFALRRAALGICQNLMAWEIELDLRWALEEAAGQLTVDASEQDREGCLAFIQRRLRGMLLDKGFNYDVVDAVLAEEGQNPYGTFLGVQALSAWVERQDWGKILPAFSRCVRIIRDLDEVYQVDESLLVEESEKLLYEAVTGAEQAMAGVEKVDAFLNAFLPMVPVVNRFFDEVLVMAEDDAVRENRLALCQRIAGLSEGAADLSCLEGF